VRVTRISFLAAAGALLAAPAVNAATVTTGSPNLAAYRGKAVAVVFFHPL
jgi:hypothetical protein